MRSLKPKYIVQFNDDTPTKHKCYQDICDTYPQFASVDCVRNFLGKYSKKAYKRRSTYETYRQFTIIKI